MKQILAVDEADECRRAGRSLSHIEYLESSALICRRLDARRGIGEQVVETAGRDTHGVLIVNIFDELKQSVEPESRFAEIKIIGA